MNQGELNKRIKVMGLSEGSTVYSWVYCYSTWAKVEETTAKSIYSTIGKSAQRVNVVIRTRPISSHEMILLDGYYHYITSIIETGLYMNLELARVHITYGECWRNRRDESRSTITRELVNQFTFPGIYTDKYIDVNDADHRFAVDTTLAVVTPKKVQLKTGDELRTPYGKFVVCACHLFNEFRNEYEIKQVSEA